MDSRPGPRLPASRASGGGEDTPSYAPPAGEEESGPRVDVERPDALPLVPRGDDPARRQARREALPILPLPPGAEYRRESCKQKMKRAKEAEAAMLGFVSRIMKDPGRILLGMNALTEQRRSEMRGDPEREARAWLERLGEGEQERRGYLRLAAKGRMSDAELDGVLAELEETRQTAER
jgi:hypothetical protein